jgi:hypothetical protein
MSIIMVDKTNHSYTQEDIEQTLRYALRIPPSGDDMRSSIVNMIIDDSHGAHARDWPQDGQHPPVQYHTPVCVRMTTPSVAEGADWNNHGVAGALVGGNVADQPILIAPFTVRLAISAVAMTAFSSCPHHAAVIN